MTKKAYTGPMDNVPAHRDFPLGKSPHAGRPTLYREEYCDRVEVLGMEGKGVLAQIAADFGVSKQAVREWAMEHREFGAALDRARGANEAFWVAKYNEAAGEQGNKMAQHWAQFYLKNIAPDDWKDRTSVDHSGSIEHIVTPAQDAYTKHLKQLKKDALEVEYVEVD